MTRTELRAEAEKCKPGCRVGISKGRVETLIAWYYGGDKHSAMIKTVFTKHHTKELGEFLAAQTEAMKD